METLNLIGCDSYNLKQYPKLFLKLNSELLGMGIKAVKCQQTIYEDTFENVLTLYLKPSYPGNTTGWTNLRSDSNFRIYLGQLTGNRAENSGYYYPLEEHEEIMIKEGRSEYHFGCYMPNRNIVVLYFNPLYSDLNLEKEDRYLFKFIEVLKEFVSKRKLETKDVSKMIEESMLNKFNKAIGDNLEGALDRVNNYYSCIATNQEDIVEKRRMIESESVSIEALKKVNKITIEGLKKQIELVKQLNFVKDVKLDNGEIVLEMPDIKIRWKEEDVSMGDYVITYQPNKIQIVNKKPIMVSGEAAHHPHIRDNSICFGNRQDKMYDLLASLKLKQLTYFVYLFLKSYNKDDCFNQISHWTGEEEEEEEQDEEEDRNSEEEF